PTAMRGGLAEHTYRNGVFREYTITVTVTDGRGGEDTAQVAVEFPRPADNQAPVIEFSGLTEKVGFDVVARVTAFDPDGDNITYTFDFGDGSEPVVNRGGEAAHSFPDGQFRAYTITVTAADGNGGQATARIAVNFPQPAENADPVLETARVLSVDGFNVLITARAFDADGDVISYRVVWGDDSPEEALPGGLGEHAFPDGVFAEYTITVIALDGNGGRAERQIVVDIARPADNRDPAVEEARLLPQGGFNALLLMSASDPDGDELTYTINWGDGSPATVSRSGVSAHAFPEGAYRTYTVTVTVDDGRGGVIELTREIDFPAPQVNAPPVIRSIDVDVGVHGEAILQVDAFDPEGGQLVYTVHWGDEADAALMANLVAGIGSHEYEFDNEPYAGWVVVTDPHGNSTRDRFSVQVVDNPTRIHALDVEVIRGRTVLAAAVASDADGTEALVYDFDFDGDGIYERRDAGRTTVYSYAADGDYTLVVRVTDPWSGAQTTRRVALRVVLGGDVGGSPLISDVRMTRGPSGELALAVDAWDPEGQPLTYRVNWGDGGPIEALADGDGLHRYNHADVFAGVVEVSDPDGNVARREVAFDLSDRATIIERVDAVPVGPGQFLVTVTAHDPDGDENLVYSFDFDSDGDFEAFNRVENRAVHTYRTPGAFFVRVEVVDQWSGATSQGEIRIDFAAPPAANQAPIIDDLIVRAGPLGETHVLVEAHDPDGDPLVLAVHWGDENEGVLEPAAEFVGRHRYAFPADGQPYLGYVVVADVHGARAERPFEAEVFDRPTRIREIGTEHIDGGTWVVDVRAHDPDGADRLRYAFDFDGDGVWDIEDSESPAALHHYDLALTYTVRVRVTDTWSGASVEGDTAIRVVPWGDDNALPLINALLLDINPLGEVTLTVDAVDPDGGPLDLVVHWGDEAGAEDVAPMEGTIADHTYAWGDAAGRWAGFVLVTDNQGASVRGRFDVQLVDRAPIIRSVDLRLVRAGAVLAEVVAEDPDGAEVRYVFDFDGDGVWDAEPQLGSTEVHTYGQPGEHRVRVGVIDQWSGAVTEGEAAIVLDPWIMENQPPVIRAVALEMGPRGQAVLTVEAEDPEGAFLDARVHWGDEAEADALSDIVGLNGRHTYPWPGADAEPFAGRVVVADPEGLTAEMPFAAAVVDHPTVIRAFRAAVVRGGEVRLTVDASDADTEGLTYAFDLDGDGLPDTEPSAEASLLHAFEGGGTYPLGVTVTDDWSGAQTSEAIEFELPPWVEEVPIAEDHLEGEEGRCLVFRIGEESGALETKVDATVCDRDVNPGENLWAWDFGDGNTARGSEVGHRYADDGVYDLIVTGGPAERPRRSRIQVFVANAAPQIQTQPRVEARRGTLYTYILRVEDQGPTDEVRVALVKGPEGMVIGRGAEDGTWRIAWEVPADFAEPTVEVEIRAHDGHLVDGEWRDDGGEAVQNFE
ncbi:MAG: PKD domain-containing protein, partial [Myxococcales bacterium]|nr:PKD domain-containing protein [Myxococcales bacterium]